MSLLSRVAFSSYFIEDHGIKQKEFKPVAGFLSRVCLPFRDRGFIC